MAFIIVRDAGSFGDLSTVETPSYGAMVYEKFEDAEREAHRMKVEKPRQHFYVAQIVTRIELPIEPRSVSITPSPPPVANLKAVRAK